MIYSSESTLCIRQKKVGIYEVKSSSSVRSYHEYDASIQWHVLKKLNIFDLNEVFIITLNNKFSKKKDKPNKPFNIHSVTEIVDKNKLEVENKINELKKSMSHKEPELKNWFTL